MLTPYSGPWTFDEASHLLRRTIFGPTKTRILQAVEDGFDLTFEKLFASPAIVDPPIYYDFEDDPEAGIGETWVDKPLDGDIDGIYFAREKTLWAWWFIQMNRNDQTITERLSLFWHNHFVVSQAGHANMNWWYLNKFRDLGLGDFKELTKQITVDRSMLIYLNGTSNFADEPNENYARELLELFTIGKGDLVAPGDYTTYTEQDVAAIAKALTGWSAWSGQDPEAVFRRWAHDTNDKQLSHRFDNQIISNEWEEEYKTVVDIIFEKDEVAYHICRRLYIWFVHYKIDEDVEQEVIAPMAQILLDNNYEIAPALLALLKSEHFFGMEKRGAMIKNPLEHFFSCYNTLQVPKPSNDITVEYAVWVARYWDFRDIGMAVFRVPSVAGWKAYHQGPLYYRDWINSASLVLRKKIIQNIKWLTRYVEPSAKGFDFLAFIATLEDPDDVNKMIDEICDLLYTRPMTTEQKDFFKSALLSGLPDFEWNVEYSEYLDDPTNEDKIRAVESKLWNMFMAMMNVPEFQLM